MSMRRSVSRSIFVAFLVSGPLVWPLSADAQSSTDSAAAQGLFDQAKQLMAGGKYVEACPKLEESQRLDPGSGTLLNLADCYEHAGRTATAWSKFLEAASAAQTTGKADREKTAREHAAALVARLAKIVIAVPDAQKIAGLEIHRDGQVVGQAQWGTPIPVDSGEHVVTASAPGRKTWQTTVKLPGDGATATATVPDLELGADASAAPRSADRAVTVPHGLGTQKTVALVAGGVGVAGVIVGSIFGLVSKSKHTAADNYCTGTSCRDPLGVDDANSARSAGNVATVGFVVGVVGLAGGAALWFTAKPESTAPQVGLGIGAVQIKGAW